MLEAFTPNIRSVTRKKVHGEGSKKNIENNLLIQK
jgi:hypothetical protein